MHIAGANPAKGFMNHQIGDLLYDRTKEKIGWITGKTNPNVAPNMPWVVEWSDGLNAWHSDIIIDHYKQAAKNLNKEIKISYECSSR